jgi:hypothetical protein
LAIGIARKQLGFIEISLGRTGRRNGLLASAHQHPTAV